MFALVPFVLFNVYCLLYKIYFLLFGICDIFGRPGTIWDGQNNGQNNGQNYGKNYCQNYSQITVKIKVKIYCLNNIQSFGKNYGQNYGQITVKTMVKITVKIWIKITVKKQSKLWSNKITFSGGSKTKLFLRGVQKKLFFWRGGWVPKKTFFGGVPKKIPP